jgi:hypothetical protein
MVTAVHQHCASKLPLRAGAQSFGAPHTGQVAFGNGRMLDAAVLEASVVQSSAALVTASTLPIP